MGGYHSVSAQPGVFRNVATGLGWYLLDFLSNYANNGWKFYLAICLAILCTFLLLNLTVAKRNYAGKHSVFKLVLVGVKAATKSI